MLIYANNIEKKLKFLIYVNSCQNHRQADKHIKTVVQNLTKTIILLNI